MKPLIHISALKYPNHAHYDWQGTLLEQTEDFIIVWCEAGRPLAHHTKQKVFTIEHASLEFFFLKEWFTAAIEFKQGQNTSYYCNIAMPSVLDGDRLSFVDLDLDLLRSPQGEWMVVDEDEFVENSVKYDYPEALKEQAVQALQRLQARAEKKTFPFDEAALKWASPFLPCSHS
ncbi:DUF402 domain-containing protein [Paenibacillus sp. JX-17]|uniref:DUF402 domain-containing protein n=1 Tax=Paenibacillus lacisoli TaxID=3064525 RepID=A0ABT9CJ51_9BACL|nr:DUF402 domain-containing protein [Paenibacillus sp. JX-17]MDO7908649.1 DUF402 domain-containing protein [Paenibacillus sp. JX-17]